MDTSKVMLDGLDQVLKNRATSLIFSHGPMTHSEVVEDLARYIPDGVENKLQLIKDALNVLIDSKLLTITLTAGNVERKVYFQPPPQKDNRLTTAGGWIVGHPHQGTRVAWLRLVPCLLNTLGEEGEEAIAESVLGVMNSDGEWCVASDWNGSKAGEAITNTISHYRPFAIPDPKI